MVNPLPDRQNGTGFFPLNLCFDGRQTQGGDQAFVQRLAVVALTPGEINHLSIIRLAVEGELGEDLPGTGQRGNRNDGQNIASRQQPCGSPPKIQAVSQQGNLRQHSLPVL